MVLLDATPTNGVGTLTVLNLLEALTARIRPHVVDPRHRDRLFIFMQPDGNPRVPRAFGMVDGLDPSREVILRTVLAKFIEDNALERFALNQIRPTILDEIQVVTGDILTAVRVGQQKNPQTLWHHYTSDGTKQRYEERLGEVFMLRERWLATEGVIDPRTRIRTAGMDRGAATPGFFCFDPFDSPHPAQAKGRLCTAYGECPSCPLAAADVSDVTTVAMYLALEKAIYAAQGRVTPKAWLTRWAPVLINLDALLAHAPAFVRTQAAALAVNFPPVG